MGEVTEAEKDVGVMITSNLKPSVQCAKVANMILGQLARGVTYRNKVQKRAIMIVTNIRGSYEERLAILEIRTLEDRRLRGDLIETFKILAGQSDGIYETWFNLARDQVGSASTRAMTGHLNLVPPPQARELRRNLFSHRVVNHWNQLPASVQFKTHWEPSRSHI